MAPKCLNWWMDMQNVVYIQTTEYYSAIKGNGFDTSDNMDKLWKH